MFFYWLKFCLEPLHCVIVKTFALMCSFHFPPDADFFLYSTSDFKTLNVNFVLLLHKYYVLVIYSNYVHILCFCINTYFTDVFELDQAGLTPTIIISSFPSQDKLLSGFDV